MVGAAAVAPVVAASDIDDVFKKATDETDGLSFRWRERDRGRGGGRVFELNVTVALQWWLSRFSSRKSLGILR